MLVLVWYQPACWGLETKKTGRWSERKDLNQFLDLFCCVFWGCNGYKWASLEATERLSRFSSGQPRPPCVVLCFGLSSCLLFVHSCTRLCLLLVTPAPDHALIITSCFHPSSVTRPAPGIYWSIRYLPLCSSLCPHTPPDYLFAPLLPPESAALFVRFLSPLLHPEVCLSVCSILLRGLVVCSPVPVCLFLAACACVLPVWLSVSVPVRYPSVTVVCPHLSLCFPRG